MIESSQTPFAFTTNHTFTQAEYDSVVDAPSSATTAWQRMLGVAFLIGVALLFWKYTIALGIVIVIATTWSWNISMRGRSRALSLWTQIPVGAAIEVSVGTTGYGMRDAGFEMHADWSRLLGGSEHAGYIRLITSGTTVLLPVEELKAAGVYERVLEKLRRNRRNSIAGGVVAIAD